MQLHFCCLHSISKRIGLVRRDGIKESRGSRCSHFCCFALLHGWSGYPKHRLDVTHIRNLITLAQAPLRSLDTGHKILIGKAFRAIASYYLFLSCSFLFLQWTVWKFRIDQIKTGSLRFRSSNYQTGFLNIKSLLLSYLLLLVHYAVDGGLIYQLR